MIGYWIIEKFTGSNDAQGYQTQAQVSNRMDMNIKATVYLPPYLRQSQCGIGVGDTVWGIVDDVTGIGAAIFGEGSADFGYFFDANVQIKKSLTVKNDVTSTDGDVLAGTISLKNHTHPITAAQFTGTIDPSTGSATGSISGNTEKPE